MKLNLLDLQIYDEVSGIFCVTIVLIEFYGRIRYLKIIYVLVGYAVTILSNRF
jgi:hypothetical protein